MKSNIRELEGSLIRLIAYTSLTGSELSVSVATEALRDLLDGDVQSVSIEAEQKVVAKHYRLTASDLKSSNTTSAVVLARRVAMYLSKELTPASLPQIGRSFGGKHHSTVIHGIRWVREQSRRDRDFRNAISNLSQSLC